jgi:acid phosphatase
VVAGRLPAVTFYKPQGNLNLHAGYSDVESGDQHVANVIEHLKKSPQWPHMLVVVTFDENGGWWDPVAPPQGDRWGPGSRVPALLVSPHVKKGHVDHTSTTPPRSCASSPACTGCRSSRAWRRAMRPSAPRRAPPGDLSAAFSFA